MRFGAAEFLPMCNARFGKRNRACATRDFFFADETIHEVFVVPNFISEGYFTQTVIPARAGAGRARSRRERTDRFGFIANRWGTIRS